MNNPLFTSKTVLFASLLLAATACGNDDDPAAGDSIGTASATSGKSDDADSASGEMTDADTDTDDMDIDTDIDTDTDTDPTVPDGTDTDALDPDPDAPPCDPQQLDAEYAWEIDPSYAHRTHTRALPLYGASKTPEDGLVRIAARGFEFRARLFGMDNDGPAIIMLHGFPSSSIMWEHAANEAAKAGYRVVAFDQRGYSPDARPEGVESYLAGEFVDDVEAIADAVGFDRFHLVGHDVGCVVSWVHATLHPDRLDSLTCLSVSHPATLADTIINDPPAYIQLFSLPNIPEGVLAANGAERLRSQYAFMNEDECREYNQIFMEPDALRATVDFYRGITDSLIALEDVIAQPVSVPTLFLYGTGEQWVTPETLEAHPMIVTSDYDEVELSDAGPTGHFIVEARRERVTELLLAHLGGVSG